MFEDSLQILSIRSHMPRGEQIYSDTSVRGVGHLILRPPGKSNALPRLAVRRASMLRLKPTKRVIGRRV